MSERERYARVGVRELRQNLSQYLERVKRGETIEVTDRGEAVSLLVPHHRRSASRRDELVAAGRLVPAIEDLLGLEPIDLGPGPPLSAVLLAMREEERS